MKKLVKTLIQAEDFIAKGVDMIALCGVESSVSEKIVKTANDAGVPIIAFTNSIGDNPTG